MNIETLDMQLKALKKTLAALGAQAQQLNILANDLFEAEEKKAAKAAKKYSHEDDALDAGVFVQQEALRYRAELFQKLADAIKDVAEKCSL